MVRKTLCSLCGLLWLCVAASAADTAFLQDAADGGMFEIQLGQLAQINGSSQLVKDFGQHAVTDHGNLKEDIQNLAGKENVKLPSDIAEGEKLTYTILSKKTGSEFDKAYLAETIKDHQAAIAAFQREVASGTDEDAKALAAKALPLLKEHLRMAQQVASQLGNSE